MKNLDKQFNLPSYVKGKSFADASKAIDKKFENRHDQASVETKNDLMNRLMMAQEAYNEQQSDNTEQAYGGNSEYLIGGALLSAGAGALVNTGVDMIKGLFGKTTEEKQQEAQEQEMAQNNVNANLMQANLANSEFDLGGFLGNIFGEPGNQLGNVSISGNSPTNQIGKALPNTDPFASSTANLDMSKLPNAPVQALTGSNLNINEGMFNQSGLNTQAASNELLGDATFGQKVGAYLKKGAKFVGDNKEEIGGGVAQAMRFLGPLGNKKQLKNLEKPSAVRLNRASNSFREQRVDKAALQAIAQNQMGNTMRGLKDATGGSQGAYRANLLGANANQLDMLSRQMLNADGQNMQQKNMKDQNQTRVDQLNLSQSNMEQDINDRNTGAYLSNKSKLQSAINNDFGSIGREWLDRLAARKTTGYTSDGKYVG